MHRHLFIATWGLLALAGAAGAREPRGLREIPDAELGAMRGRYTIGGDRVAWFGVSMISTWQNGRGLDLQGALALGMRFDAAGGRPQLSFQPTVSIGRGDAPAPSAAARSVDGSGLADVAGLVQSVQVAGDGNLADNLATLRISRGKAPADAPSQAPATASVRDGAATVAAGFDGRSARVALRVAGQGAVQQWIRAGSLGQSVQLGADGQQVRNQLRLDLVLQAMPAGRPLNESVNQAIGLASAMGRF